MSDALAIIDDYVAKIAVIWNRTRDDVIAMGRLILEAKAALPHGAFGQMIRDKLPFGERQARRFMAIAEDTRLAERTHESVLPASAETLYQLTRLDDQSFQTAIEAKAISPAMQRGDAAMLLRQARSAPQRAAYETRRIEGCRVADLTAHAAAGYRYPVILADPPWEYATYSGRGQDRGAKWHYDTQSLEEIVAMPVADLAAPNCALALWFSGAFVRQAITVAEGWGFAVVTILFDWLKTDQSGQPKIGGGHYSRATNEFCLLATIGRPKVLDNGVPQGFAAPLMEHSRKPDVVHEGIERMFAGPYLELYARRGRPNWTVWGDEIPRDLFGLGAEAPAPLALRGPPWSNADVAAVKAAAAEGLLSEEIEALTRIPRSVIKGWARHKGFALLSPADAARRRAKLRREGA